MYYNDSFFYANSIYILLLIPVLILTFFAHILTGTYMFRAEPL